jgi:hypothetical protein
MRRLIGAFILFFPLLAVAQEVVAPALTPSASAGSGADLALTIYAAIGSLITALLGWLSVRASAWLKAKTGNELVGGALARITDSVFTAVKLVNQTLRREIEAAKAPGSALGAAISAEEASKLKEAVWTALRAEYGGMAGIGKALAVLGLGSDDSLKTFVDSKIEAAVHDVNASRPRMPSA